MIRLRLVRVPVILDVDTGVDDACALLFAARHPGLDLRAVTCVGGNASLADVTRNTLTVPLPIRVELTGRYTRGRTVVDHRDWSGDLAHDPHGQSDVVAEVALAIDGPRFARLWMDTMNAGPTP